MTVKILLMVGGLNWGLVGVAMLLGNGADWNIVHLVLTPVPTLEAVVYVLVGLAAVMKIVGCKCDKCKVACASCDADGKMSDGM